MKETNYKDLPDMEKRKLQEQFHENDLNYLSSFAFESNAIKQEDLDDLNKRIDQRVSGGKPKFNRNLFISLGSAIILGSAFFALWYNNNSNDQKIIEDIAIKTPAASNTEVIADAVEPSKTDNTTTKTASKEHFNISESGEHLNLSTPMEDLAIKDINSVEVKGANYTPSEEILNYIPNSSVIYLHDLKIANYKNYYFKNNRNIDVRDNGLSAQYSNKDDANTLSKRLQDQDYYAHEIIKDAMGAFNKKQYAACIELLELLRGYNKEDVNTQFYLGMSNFYLGDYSKARTYFDKATNNDINVFLQESEFYTALCLKKTGKTTEANELFKKIAAKKLFYAQRATEELN
jgi:hypothetical protein